MSLYRIDLRRRQRGRVETSLRSRLPLCLEELERRRLLAYTVNDPGDAPLDPDKGPAETSSGTVTLRSAIEQVNDDGGGLIAFAGPMTISIGSQLDALTAPGVTIDGGTSGSVVITGGSGFDGLVLDGGGATIQNLVVDDFGEVGIYLESSGNTIQNDDVGTNALGTSAMGNDFGISDSVGHNIIQQNLISGNSSVGIALYGASDDQVVANFIGTDVTGTKALGNEGGGVSIYGGASGNTIGGTTASDRNIISGNANPTMPLGYAGVEIVGAGTTGNVVEGNFIGTDITGAKALGNANGGVSIFEGASGNTIGGTTASARNIISGNATPTAPNGYAGVELIDTGTTHNVVEGNFIGTDVTGTKALGNANGGVSIFDGASGNTIGGTTAAARNLISGNEVNPNVLWSGVEIENTTGTGSSVSTTGNVVEGNFIGTDITGTKALGNAGGGVAIYNGASDNTIGGTSSAAANVISGNGGDGIDIDGSGTAANMVTGNFIGTDANGDPGLGNADVGISVVDGATSNTIGGTNSGSANVIAANGGDGLDLTGSGTIDNVVAGNVIGTSADGSIDLGNQGNGISIMDASGNTIGGTSEGAANVVGNSGVQNGVIAAVSVLSGTGTGVEPAASSEPIGNGILVMGQATDNLIQGDYIGITTDGQSAGNADNGIMIEGASNNTIGAQTPGALLGNLINFDPASNTIVGNSHDGVQIEASTNTSASADLISQNIIYNNGYMGIELGDDGINAPNDYVGSNGPSADNWQSYPIIYSITSTSSDPTISFFVPVPGPNNAPTATGDSGASYVVEFYANTNTDASGLSEGEQFLGSATVKGDEMQTIAFTPTTAGAQYITGIAIDPNGNTSEFSPCLDLLRNSVHQGTTPAYAQRPQDITMFFEPNNIAPGLLPGTTSMTLARAAQLCDVNHFNWTQTITGLPSDDVQFEYPLTANFPPPDNLRSYPTTLYDPCPSSTSDYGIHSDIAQTLDPTDYPKGDVFIEPTPGGNDNFDYYINENQASLNQNYYKVNYQTQEGFLNGNASTSNALLFYDGADSPQPFNPNNGATSFHTEITGVFGLATASSVIWTGIPMTNFNWSSNAITTPTGAFISGSSSIPVYDFASPGEVLPPIISGGLFDVEYDVGGTLGSATMLSAVSGNGANPGTGTLTATLTSNGSPVSDVSVTFSLWTGNSVTTVGSATTNAEGIATLTNVSLSNFNAGVYPGAVEADVAPSADHAGSTAVGKLSVSSSGVVLPPPLVTVTAVQDKTNKKHEVTEVIVSFSGSLNASAADRTSLYRLAYPGRKGSYTAKNAQVIKLKSAVYNATNDAVVLTPKKAFALTKKVQLQVDGAPPSGLQDSDGRYIDGADNGMAGSNAITILARNGATDDAVTKLRPNDRTRKTNSGRGAVVDALLERGELTGARHGLLARREKTASPSGQAVIARMTVRHRK